MKKSTPDYEKKAIVIELGIDKEIRKIDSMIWKYEREGNHNARLNIASTLLEKIEEWGFDLWVEGRKVNSAYYARKTRIWKYIYAMMLQNQPVIFLTFTFTDETIDKTSYDTRRKYVQRFLKDHSDYYIANIDFGEDNGREHYHAIIVGEVDYSEWHKYGAIKGLRVHNSVDDAKRLAKYVSKLTNHAIKKTTGGHRVIYSRKLKSLLNGEADGSIPLRDSPVGAPGGIADEVGVTDQALPVGS